MAAALPEGERPDDEGDTGISRKWDRLTGATHLTFDADPDNDGVFYSMQLSRETPQSIRARAQTIIDSRSQQ